MPAETRLSYRVFGTPGSPNLVVLVGTGIGVSFDPQPVETAARDVYVLAVSLGAEAMVDPGGYGSETPAEQSAAWLVSLVEQTLEATRPPTSDDAPTAGMVAYGGAADVALRAAVELGTTIGRLVLVAVAAPEQPLDRDDLGAMISGVTAETLIVNGQREPGVDESAADWYRTQLASARVEMVPDEEELSLATVWGRALSFASPGTQR